MSFSRILADRALTCPPRPDCCRPRSAAPREPPIDPCACFILYDNSNPSEYNVRIGGSLAPGRVVFDTAVATAVTRISISFVDDAGLDLTDLLSRLCVGAEMRYPNHILNILE